MPAEPVLGLVLGLAVSGSGGEVAGQVHVSEKNPVFDAVPSMHGTSLQSQLQVGSEEPLPCPPEPAHAERKPVVRQLQKHRSPAVKGLSNRTAPPLLAHCGNAESSQLHAQFG